ncbi:MAG: hypothetical protein ABI384_00995 [Allobranchiibius sp.]
MSDHNIWPNTTYDDPLAARAWLVALGFQEGTLVLDDAGGVRHSEMLWPEGGRVMVSERSDPTTARAVSPSAIPKATPGVSGPTPGEPDGWSDGQ